MNLFCPKYYNMIFRTLGLLRGLSTVILLFVLMYVYANMPENVALSTDEAGLKSDYISRPYFFFGALGLAVFANLILYAFGQLAAKAYSSDIRSQRIKLWTDGLGLFMNLFFVMILFFFNAFNGGERFDFSYLSYPIYISLGLVVIWALSLIPILLIRKS